MNYAAWTPATDTAEIRSDLRGPYFEAATVALPFPWFLPEVPRRHRMMFAARVRILWLRVLSSAFAHDVRRSVAAAYWPLMLGGGLVLGLGLLLVTRGHFLTWGGIESIPVGGAR